MPDVAARLAQGRPAVDNTSTYVTACRQLGFAGPTDQALRESYETEDGLDLAALQADSDALHAAAAAADDAARLQAGLTARMAAAWSGDAGAVAHDVAARHAAAADSARDALADAAATTSALRDELWAAVDSKVTAVLDVDDRPAGRRGEWIDAATTVATGAGDVAAASELVDQQVKPFVDNDVESELLGEMRASFDRVTAAFDAAIARLDACPAADFESLGGRGEVAAATVPAALPQAPEVPVEPAPALAPAPAPAPAAPPLGSEGAGLSGMSGMSGMSGVSGFGQQLADLIGGLFGGGGASSGALDGGLGLDDPLGADRDDEPGDELKDDPGDDGSKDEDPEDEKPQGDEPEPEPDPESEEPAAPPAPVEPPPPAPVETLPPADAITPVPAAVPDALTDDPPDAPPDALPAEKTPCEIAAEELPNVGG